MKCSMNNKKSSSVFHPDLFADPALPTFWSICNEVIPIVLSCECEEW
jgi:hypothetical protein